MDNHNYINNSDILTPVHYGCSAVKMEQLLKLSKNNDSKIIEDAAQSLGVFIDNKHVGTFGTFEFYLFIIQNSFIQDLEALLVNDEKYFDEAMKFIIVELTDIYFQKEL